MKILKNRYVPKFLGMKEEDIYSIECCETNIIGLNDKGRQIYSENVKGWWWKREYSEDGKHIKTFNSNGKIENIYLNDRGKAIYYENTEGIWWKREFLSGSNKPLSYEDSEGNWEKIEYGDYGPRKKSISYTSSNGMWKKIIRDDNGSINHIEKSADYDFKKTILYRML